MTFEVSVGQVIERDRLFQTEEALYPTEQMGFNCFPMRHQGIRGPIQAGEGQALIIDIDQFSQGALFLQPAPGG